MELAELYHRIEPFQLIHKSLNCAHSLIGSYPQREASDWLRYLDPERVCSVSLAALINEGRSHLVRVLITLENRLRIIV